MRAHGVPNFPDPVTSSVVSRNTDRLVQGGMMFPIGSRSTRSRRPSNRPLPRAGWGAPEASRREADPAPRPPRAPSAAQISTSVTAAGHERQRETRASAAPNPHWTTTDLRRGRALVTPYTITPGRHGPSDEDLAYLDALG